MRQSTRDALTDLTDGEFFAGRRFDTRTLAVQWAELERQASMQDGHA